MHVVIGPRHSRWTVAFKVSFIRSVVHVPSFGVLGEDGQLVS